MKPFPTIVLLLLFLSVPTGSPALTMEEGLKIVAESGRDIRIAQSAEEAARGGVSLARSPWLPQVNAYGNETWLRHEPTIRTPFGSLFVTGQDRFLTYGVTANQLLYDFGKTSSSVGAAKFALEAREIETRRARNRSSLEFILAYYDLLEADKLLQVAAGEVKQYEAHLHDANVRYQAGAATRNDVLQAEVTLADSRQRYLVAENNRSLRASRINSLLLRSLNEPVQAAEVTKTAAPAITLETAWAAAEAESPEIQVIDANIRAKGKNIESVQAEYFPTFFLSGGYQYQENENMVYPRNWSVIAGMNFTLFSGGATGSRVHIAKSELTSLRITRDKIVDAVRLDVKAAHLNLISAAQQIDVTRAAVEQAEENLRLRRLRYTEGVGTDTEVLDAVTLLTASHTGTWRAQYQFERAEAALLYSMGRDLTGVYGQEEL